MNFDLNYLPQLSVALVCIIVCAWSFAYASNKGFDLTDESIYFMQVERPQDVVCYPFFDFYYTHLFHRLTRKSIQCHRLALLFLSAAVGAFFAWGAVPFLQSLFPGKFIDATSIAWVYLLCIASSHVRFSCGPRLIYYNNLNSFVFLSSSALCFRAIFAESEYDFYYILAAGYLVGFQVFIKISSFLGNICTIAALAVCATLPDLLLALKFLSALSLGACGAFLFHFIFLQNPLSCWRVFSTQMTTARSFRWGTGCIPRHKAEVRIYFNRILDSFKWHFILLAAFSTLSSILPAQLSELAFVCSALTLFDLVRAHFSFNASQNKYPIFEEEVGVTVGRLFAAISIFCLGSCLADAYTGFRGLSGSGVLTPTSLACLLYLVVVPFLGAIGTSNHVYSNFVYQLTSWCVPLLVVIQVLLNSKPSPVLSSLLGIVIVVFYALPSFYLSMWKPYRLVGSLFDQTEPTTIGLPGVTLKLEARSKQFLEEVRHEFNQNGFKEGDPILGFFDCPGLVYFMGGRSPGHQWYYIIPPGVDESMKANHYHLKRVDSQVLRDSFIIEKSHMEAFRPYLKDVGLNFPDDYVQVGSSYWPFYSCETKIWKPRHLVTEEDRVSYNIEIEKTLRFLEIGDVKSAIGTLKNAVDKRPEEIPLKVDYANLLVNDNQLRQAKVVLLEVLEQDPNCVQASTALAKLKVELGEFASPG